MTAPGIYRAKVVAPFSNGSCDVVIPQLFGDIVVNISRFVGSTLPLSPTMGWVMFEGGDENNPVWIDTDTSVISADWYVTQAEADAKALEESQALSAGMLGLQTQITSNLASTQPLDADLTSIAALATTAYGRSLLTTVDGAGLAGNVSPTLDARYGLFAGRNLLDNSQHAINQRQNTGVVLTGGVAQYAADRWAIYNSGVGAATLNWTTMTAFGQTIPTGRPRPATINNITVTTAEAAGAIAAADFMQWTQAVEGVNLQDLAWGTANAQPATYSFDIYSTVAATYVVELLRLETAQRSISMLLTVPAGFSTQAVTFPGDVTTLTTNDLAARLYVTVFVAAGSNLTAGGVLQTAWGASTANRRAFGISNTFNATIGNQFSIVNTQFEAGSVATPLEHRAFADELRRCERFLEKSYSYGVAPGSNSVPGSVYAIGVGALTTSVDPGPPIVYRVRKRATPTLSFWRVDGTAGSWLWGGNSGSVNQQSNGETGFSTYTTTTSGLSPGTIYTVAGHWLATAEIP